MRKLATIQKINTIKPIEGADHVERLNILGWTLVSQKGNFAADDLCVYIEPDAQLPEEPEFDFLLDGLSPEDRANPDKVRRALRLTTRKIRKVVSEGLALPLRLFKGKLPRKCKVGDDVTVDLGITKYEPPETNMPREIEGKFPARVPKTDETRIQAVPDLLNELRGIECYVSVKMDGQSLTFAKLRDAYTGEDSDKVCTRNFALKPLEDSPHWKMARKLGVFDQLPPNFALQGEFVGANVNGNRLGLKHNEFYAFQIWNIANQRYLDYSDFVAKCAEWNIPTVPMIQTITLDHSVDQLLEMAAGKYPNNFPREGIVIRPTIERSSAILAEYGSHDGARASFKVINPDFLLKIKE